ncbi:MAG: AMIN-like domain-containing (lipo)protein, partial [Candidatus Limnocylindria bacterium]
MRHYRAASIVIVGVLLAGCIGESASPSASNVEASMTPFASAPPAASAPAASASVEPVPSAALGPFSCDLPVVEDATVALANITDVRVGTHADHDRVVFEFADGLPEITLDRATPPLTHDATGMPIEVDGSSFVRLTMRGGTKQTADGTSSYDGPTDFDPAFAGLVDLVEGGDFEAQSTWYLGLASEACVRVLRLTDDGAPR